MGDIRGGRAKRIHCAFSASAGLRACRRIGKIGTLTRRNTVRSARKTLTSWRWRHVIIVSAVLVVGDEDNGILPMRAVANRAEYLRDVGLAALYVRWGMLVVFRLGSKQAEIRVHERHLGQRSKPWRSRSLR